MHAPNRDKYMHLIDSYKYILLSLVKNISKYFSLAGLKHYTP